MWIHNVVLSLFTLTLFIHVHISYNDKCHFNYPNPTVYSESSGRRWSTLVLASPGRCLPSSGPPSHAPLLTHCGWGEEGRSRRNTHLFSSLLSPLRDIDKSHNLHTTFISKLKRKYHGERKDSCALLTDCCQVS